MARTLDQIIAELNPTYQPQIESIQKQQELIPGQIASQEQSLSAQKDKGYADILSGARRRGTGVAFGGIPLAEQAQYNATQYAPALANLRTAGTQQAMSLQDALNQIQERKQTTAQGIYQTEQDREFQARENAANRAATAASAAASAFNPSQFISDFSKANTPQPTTPKISRDAKGGFQFTDAYGEPVNAAEYTQLYQMGGGNLTYRQLLQRMADDGDLNAKVGLMFVGDDAKFGNAPEQFRSALNAIGATGTFGKNTFPAGTSSVLLPKAPAAQKNNTQRAVRKF